jgi:smad nuclear-interacting protein 1
MSDGRKRSSSESDRRYQKKAKARDNDDDDSNDVYPKNEQWGKKEEEPEEPEVPIVKEKAFFGLTGLLSKDKETGNIVNGVVLKYSEALDASKPDQLWRFYVFKDDKVVETLHIHRKSCFLLGRDHRVADIVLAHPSCSQQHAVIQFRRIKKRTEEGETVEYTIPYLMDLKSANKTYVNGEEIDDSRYLILSII